jgi:hypothetical protein
MNCLRLVIPLLATVVAGFASAARGAGIVLASNRVPKR